MKLTIILTITMAPLTAATAQDFVHEERVSVAGYDGHLMEPFLTRDGKILFFNNRNEPAEETDLHYAVAREDGGFDYQGLVKGANSAALDGVASLDRGGRFYFTSTRSYDQTRATLYSGVFKDGEVRDVALIGGEVSKNKLLRLNMDSEISADGERLYFTDNKWRLFGGGIKTSNLTVAERRGDEFYRIGNGRKIFEKINTKMLEYAASLTADELTLFFSRAGLKKIRRKDASGFQILTAVRAARDAPFGEPALIAAATGYVEAPTVSPDGCTLFYHRMDDGVFRLYKLTREDCPAG